MNAEKLLPRAVEQPPNAVEIQYHLCRAYYRLGKKADAVSTLLRAAILDPKLARTEKISDLIKQLVGIQTSRERVEL